MPDLSVLVVVVTYNSASTIERFLATLPAASTRTLLDVVVVDNDSMEWKQTEAISKKYGRRFLRAPSNLGYGAGAMIGVGRSKQSAEFVLVANPDLTFQPGAIDILVAAAAQNPGAGSLGPRVLEPNGTIYPSARALPSLRVGVGHAIFGTAWPGNPWSRRYRRDDTASEPERRAAGWLSGACLLIRRTAWDSVGGFDPSYFMYFEDVDLGARLAKAGWLNLYIPDAVVTHTGGESTSKNVKLMARAHHQSAYLYLSRKYSGWQWAPVRFALRIGLAIRLWRTTSS